MYVIECTAGRYRGYFLKCPNGIKKYTNKIEEATTYKTLHEAIQDCCQSEKPRRIGNAR